MDEADRSSRLETLAPARVQKWSVNLAPKSDRGRGSNRMKRQCAPHPCAWRSRCSIRPHAMKRPGKLGQGLRAWGLKLHLQVSPGDSCFWGGRTHPDTPDTPRTRPNTPGQHPGGRVRNGHGDFGKRCDSVGGASWVGGSGFVPPHLSPRYGEGKGGQIVLGAFWGVSRVIQR